MTSLLLPLLAILGVSLPEAEPLDNGVAVYRGLAFATNDEEALELDLYTPPRSGSAMPAIVVITGGAFLAEDRKKFKDEARTLAEAGFVAASISYRGLPRDTFPAPVYDAKAAVRYLRANAETFKIDPNRIGAFGQSAGGYLAAMLAVTGGEPDLEGNGGNPAVSSRIKVAVCFSGLFDFVRGEGGEQDGGSIARRAFNRLWIGAPLEENRPLWEKASPINHLTVDDAPMLLIHSLKDSMVPFSQSQCMYDALKAVRPETKLLLLEEGGHNIRDNRKVKGQAWEAAIQYFQEHLAG